MRSPHPVLLVEQFLKQAEDAQRPYGMGDARKGMSQRNPGKGIQTYTAPNPATAATRPDLIQAQKALPPPPVT